MKKIDSHLKIHSGFDSRDTLPTKNIYNVYICIHPQIIVVYFVDEMLATAFYKLQFECSKARARDHKTNHHTTYPPFDTTMASRLH